MKNTFIILLLFSSITSFSQNKKHDKIKALKIAYITEKLDLTEDEAQVFWPIYNEFFNTNKQLKRNKRKEINKFKATYGNNPELIPEKEASILVSNIIDIEKNEFHTKEKLYNRLRKAFSAKKILLLMVAEKEFNRKLLRNLENRKKR